MVPETPTIPPFPTLHWSYDNEKYCINENDADKLLDYGENKMPLFIYQLDQYTRQIQLIFKALKEPEPD